MLRQSHHLDTVKTLLIAFLLFASNFGPALTAAEEHSKSDTKPGADSGKEKSKGEEPKEIAVQTKHSVEIGGTRINYTATAGRILLRDSQEKPTAAIFYIAYTRDDVTDLSKRPITFSFNGGPGSSSVWLHLGLLGTASGTAQRRRQPLSATVPPGR